MFSCLALQRANATLGTPAQKRPRVPARWARLRTRLREMRFEESISEGPKRRLTLFRAMTALLCALFSAAAHLFMDTSIGISVFCFMHLMVKEKLIPLVARTCIDVEKIWSWFNKNCINYLLIDNCYLWAMYVRLYILHSVIAFSHQNGYISCTQSYYAIHVMQTFILHSVITKCFLSSSSY